MKITKSEALGFCGIVFMLVGAFYIDFGFGLVMIGFWTLILSGMQTEETNEQYRSRTGTDV